MPELLHTHKNNNKKIAVFSYTRYKKKKKKNYTLQLKSLYFKEAVPLKDKNVFSKSKQILILDSTDIFFLMRRKMVHNFPST